MVPFILGCMDLFVRWCIGVLAWAFLISVCAGVYMVYGYFREQRKSKNLRRGW